jgi:hypothetical protein
MNKNVIKVGEIEVELICVENQKSVKEAEVSGEWITGIITIGVPDGRDTQMIEVGIGCWSDTDDDHQEWCVGDEGEKIISAILGEKTLKNTRLIFPDLCTEIGKLAAKMLRDECGK